MGAIWTESLPPSVAKPGLLASLPWFADPIIKHRLLKNYLLPHKSDKTGTGKSMAVSAEPGSKNTKLMFELTLTKSQYRDKNFDDMLTDPQSKHENALAKELVKHNESQTHSLMIFVIQGSCKPRALMATP